MVRFIVQRLVFIVFVSIIIVFAVHLGMQMVDNSDTSQPDFDVVANGKIAWGETQIYLNNLIRGNFGTYEAPWGTQEVKDTLKETYLNSMGLLLTALTISIFFGLLIGAFIALSKRRQLVLPLLTITLLGISAPSFFSAIFLQTAELKYYSTFGRHIVSVAGFGWDFRHMLFPVLVLMARPLAYLTRSAFISLDRVMEEQFITTAYSKGLRQRRVVIGHALKNIAVPVLTAAGVSLRFSLSTLPVVEFFFAWPGIGWRLVDAINNRTTVLVVTLALALGLTIQLVNFSLDIIYRMVDPRLREVT